MDLFEYIYSLAAGSVNDRTSKNWMPSVLERAENPESGELVLPIRIARHDAGELEENSEVIQSAFCDSWYSLACLVGKKIPGFNPEAYQAVPHPENPYPRICFEQLMVDGLFNARIADTPEHVKTAAGYDAILTVGFNPYADLRKVKISGNFTLSQRVCAVDANGSSPTKDEYDMGSTVGWPDKDITINGKMVMYVTDLSLDVDVSLKITGTGSERALETTARGIKIYGVDRTSYPSWTVDRDALDVNCALSTFLVDVIMDTVENALHHPDTQESITAMVNKSLLGLTADMGQLMNNFLNGSLDDTLGTVPAGKLPVPGADPIENPGDQYVFDRVRYAVCLPEGKHYLPVFVAETDGVTEPYKIACISLPSFEALLYFENVTLKNVSILGLTNLFVTPGGMRIKDGRLYTDAILSALNPPPKTDGAVIPPPPLRISGDFYMTAQDVPFTGKLNVTVTQSSLSLISRFLADRDLDIIHEWIEVAPASWSALTIKLEMESQFTSTINVFLNRSDEIKARIMAGINDGLKGYLPDLSRETTAKARKMLKEYTR